MLDELKGDLAIASNIVATSVRTSTTCDICGFCNIDKVKLDIIPLPLAKSISLSLDRYLSSENLTGATNGFAKHVMDLWTVQERPRLLYLGSILVLELLCYDNFKGLL